MTLSQIIGFTGTGIVAVAYIPQIQHLIKEHCSAGISIRAYSLWFLASVLFLVHAAMIKDPVFIFVQVVNFAAIAAIVIFCKRYENEMCLTHLRNLKQAEIPGIECVSNASPVSREGLVRSDRNL